MVHAVRDLVIGLVGLAFLLWLLPHIPAREQAWRIVTIAAALFWGCAAGLVMLRHVVRFLKG